MKVDNKIFFNDGLMVDYFQATSRVDLTVQQAVDKFRETTKDKSVVVYNDFAAKSGGKKVFAHYYQRVFDSSGTFSIYKKTPQQKYYDYVCDLTNVYDLYDYNITNNSAYHYLVAYKYQQGDGVVYKIYQDIASIDEDGEVIPYPTEKSRKVPAYQSVKWDDWSICDIEETEDPAIYKKVGDVWNIRYNLSSGEITENNSVTTWDSLGKYPKISIGQKNYASSNVTAFLGQIFSHSVLTNKLKFGDVYDSFYERDSYTEKTYYVNDQVYDPEEKYIRKYAKETERYEAWKKFITNGKNKLLKDCKGHSWIVQVMANPTSAIDTISNLQQTTISFQWQEIMDVKSISIISE